MHEDQDKNETSVNRHAVDCRYKRVERDTEVGERTVLVGEGEEKTGEFKSAEGVGTPK